MFRFVPSHVKEFVALFKDNFWAPEAVPINIPLLLNPWVDCPIEIYGDVLPPAIVMLALPEALVPTFIVFCTNDSLDINISAATKNESVPNDCQNAVSILGCLFKFADAFVFVA